MSSYTGCSACVARASIDFSITNDTQTSHEDRLYPHESATVIVHNNHMLGTLICIFTAIHIDNQEITLSQNWCISSSDVPVVFSYHFIFRGSLYIY